MERRGFLRGLAAVPLAGVVGTPAAAAATGRRVVVLGAGLAGLTTAYNLMRHGYDVVVLEAQNRPGGRVQTARAGFQRGGHAELGAVRIFEKHEHTLKYVKEFGLELIPYETGTRAFFMQGKRFLPPEPGTPWPLDGFAPDEQPDPNVRLGEVFAAGFAMVGDAFDPGWPANVPSALELDQYSIESFARAQGASDTLLEWVYAQEGRLTGANAAAGFASGSLSGGTTAQSIKGGNDRLPYAFAAALGSRVKYNSQVVRIAQDKDSVTIGYIDRTGRHELRADRCVCTLPFGPLRRVSTSFSSAKTDAIAKLLYYPAARCYFQTRSRFWQNDPLGPLGGLGLVASDTMANRIWNTSSQQADSRLGMLQSYMLGPDAAEYAALGRRRIPAVLGLADRLLPGTRDQVVGVVEKVWHEDRWAGGGFAWTQPGDMHWIWPAIRRIEGRVHFAGEHTSLWAAWMNGAIESAERVIQEVLSS